jgi:multidrug transporter EmrE-like cation transporter
MPNATAQRKLKLGMMVPGSVSLDGLNPMLKIPHIVFSPWVFFGLFAFVFVISIASHLYVLSKVDISFAYLFLSLAYVAAAVFAYSVFREGLNTYRIACIASDCIGTVKVAQSGCGHAEDFATTSNLENSNELTR